MSNTSKTEYGKPRLAIIGCGAVVDTHILPALRRQGWAPCVLVDRSPERLTLLAGRAGRKRSEVVTASDWTSVADQFDAAIVATPHTTHGPIGLALLEAGKHVFMEKPLATKMEEGHAMIAAAAARDRVLGVGLLRRYLTIARWTKALIDSGTIGPILRFEAKEGFIFNWATSSDALLRLDLSGGGVLMDTGAHTLDILNYWMGELTPAAYCDDGESGVEADCVAEFLLPSGGRGRVELSRTRELRNTVRIEGAHGFVEVALYKNEVVAGSANALAFQHDGISPAAMKPQMFNVLFDSEMQDFLKAASGGPRDQVSGHEGIRSLRLIQGCYDIRQPLEMPWADAATPAPVEFEPGSRVVVTGASGFIGGRLVERMVKGGMEVTCIIREIGHATRPARLPVKLVRADMTNEEEMRAALRGADYVFHCAYDPRSRKQNLDGARIVIKICAEQGVRRLVHVSTFSVYEPFPDGMLTEETRDGDRSWTYTRDKLEIETAVLTAAKEQGLPATVVQPTIVYGPFCKPWTNAPAEMLIFGEVVLPGKGEGQCNAVFVDDLIDGMLLAATRKEAIGERFILSGPEPVTWANFYTEFARALSVAPPVFWDSDKIGKSNHGLARDVKLVLKNPKRIMQIIVRWNPARQALQAGLEALPKPLRGLVDRYYFGSGGRAMGEVHIPDPQKAKLYMAQCRASNAKAEALLGYVPRHGFAEGMSVTRKYLDWAFTDLRRIARQGEDAPAPPAAPIGSEVADVH